MSDTDLAVAGAGRRARGGGGSARRAERTAVSLDTAKFIQRNIPNFEILNEEALQIIEWNAETVLEEIGVNFVENPEALKRWKDAGADVQASGCASRAGWRGRSVPMRRPPLPSMRETRRGMSISAGAIWCWPRSMARPSCATWKAGGAMRRSRISRTS